METQTQDTPEINKKPVLKDNYWLYMGIFFFIIFCFGMYYQTQLLLSTSVFPEKYETSSEIEQSTSSIEKQESTKEAIPLDESDAQIVYLN